MGVIAVNKIDASVTEYFHEKVVINREEIVQNFAAAFFLMQNKIDTLQLWRIY